jgi:stage V sporulation protein AB
MLNNMFTNILMCIIGVSSGLMVAAGVFTVLFVVGLIPRFAGRTYTAKYELFYEECLVFGAIAGDVLSVFSITASIDFLPRIVQTIILIIIGIFTGIFIGCLAIALSEVLDGIPIFARRVKLKKGVSIAVLAVAIGKLVGSLIYFINGFYVQTF